MSSDVVIRVEKISKRYRIGEKEKGYKTFREAIIDGIAAPVRNFKRLQKLTKFKNEKHKEQSNDIIWALKDVNMEVKQGEVVGIIGRNGAGKTTLLKILSRITEPTLGDVKLYGRVSSLLEVGTGFHPELTGRENIFLNGAILGMRKTEIVQKFDEIVDFSEIGKFIDTPVKRYSSGMYVRLAFAVAGHLEPEILLVDEVLAVGDVAFQKKCMGKMSDVARTGRTVLFVSHNMGAIRNLCERVLLIDDGKIVLDDTAEHTITRYLDQGLVVGAIASTSDIEARMQGVIKRDKPYIRFREIALLNGSGHPQKSFYSDEAIIVSVTYECLQPAKDLRILLQVVDENNVPILTTQNVDDPDTLANFHRFDQGIYNASCILPENTFGEKKLFLTVHLIYPKTEHLHVDKILEFDIKFVGYNNVQYGAFPNVFIRPRLSWTIKANSRKQLQGDIRIRT